MTSGYQRKIHVNTSILGDIPIGILLLDKNKNILMTNSDAEQLLDLDVKELKGKNYSELINKELENDSWIYRKNNTKDHTLLISFHDMINGDNLCKHLVILIDSIGLYDKIQNGDNGVKEWELLLTKLNSIRQANKTLKTKYDYLKNKYHEYVKTSKENILETTENKSQLLNRIGHDIKVPLTPIISLLSSNKDLFDTPKQKEHLKIINKNINHILSIINDVLSFNKISEAIVTKENNNLNSMINDIVEAYKPLCLTKGINISHSLSVNVPTVKFSEVRMREVIENLIKNSIDYIGEGNQITLSTRMLCNHVLISIKDDGIGVTEKEKEKIFSEYYSSPRSSVSKNTGLGLSITKQIVEQHSGHIWVESIGPGKGTTFFIELPTKRGM